MKSIFIAATIALLSITAVAQNNINFPSAPNAADPIRFTATRAILGSDCVRYTENGTACLERAPYVAAQTNSGQIRLVLQHGNITIYNSAGYALNTYPVTAEVAARFALVFSRTSTACPVAVSINRQSLQVESIQPRCDEYD